MKRLFLITIMLCLFISLSARENNAISPHTLSYGLHYYYHLFEPEESVAGLEYFFLCSRLGIQFDYIYRLFNTIGLGIEAFIDADMISFAGSVLGLRPDGGLFEFGGKVLFSYKMDFLEVIPFFGARSLSVIGYNLEGGLRLAIGLSRGMVLDAEGSFIFAGGGINYIPHGGFSIGVRFRI